MTRDEFFGALLLLGFKKDENYGVSVNVGGDRLPIRYVFKDGPFEVSVAMGYLYTTVNYRTRNHEWKQRCKMSSDTIGRTAIIDVVVATLDGRHT